jgi:SAM-dependent methyltransferase
MINILKKLLSDRFLSKLVNSTIMFYIVRFRYRLLRRPLRHTETFKALPRRNRENFFSSYCNGVGLDIGYGGDLLAANCLGYDVEDGNAQLLDGMRNEKFDFVYSSHTLEHLADPAEALFNWWRVVKSGGVMILYIPHRDLYEKKATLPSRWNLGHRQFFTLDKDESPDTIGILTLIANTLTGYELIYAKICDEGHTITDPLIHSDGEYSIEVVLKKLY